MAGLRIRSSIVQDLLASSLGLLAVEIVTYRNSIGLIDRISQSCLAVAGCSPSDFSALIDAVERDDGIRQVPAITEVVPLRASWAQAGSAVNTRMLPTVGGGASEARATSTK
jgi:hypothetical protein